MSLPRRKLVLETKRISSTTKSLVVLGIFLIAGIFVYNEYYAKKGIPSVAEISAVDNLDTLNVYYDKITGLWMDGIIDDSLYNDLYIAYANRYKELTA